MPGGSSRAIHGVIYMRGTALYRSQCHTYRNAVKIYKHYIFCFILSASILKYSNVCNPMKCFPMLTQDLGFLIHYRQHLCLRLLDKLFPGHLSNDCSADKAGAIHIADRHECDGHSLF